MEDWNKPIIDENGNALKHLEIGKHHCIRCIKKIRALKKIGYEVHGMGNVTPYGTSDYSTFSVWKSKQQLQNSVKLYIENGIKSITYNNEPNEPTYWIKEVIESMGVQDKVKLILDGHDWDQIRLPQRIIPIAERKAINAADGIIFPSIPIQEEVVELNQIWNKPSTVIYSYCNKGVVNYNIEERSNRKALVYEGGANVPNDKTMNTMYPYRNVLPIMKQLVAQGNEVHAYLGNPDAYIKGQGMGVILYPPTDYDKMMEALTKFKWGLLIFNNKDDTEPQVRYTLTNKAQEYLQAGLPSLACWCEETEKWVKKHNIGLTFSDISQIGNCSEFEEQYVELFNNITTKRDELVMENFIARQELLMADLLGLERKGIPKHIEDLWRLEYGNEDVDFLLKK